MFNARSRRKSRLEQLSRTQVATPCHVPWESMAGDDKVRFCGQCQLHVYNLSAIDVEEAAERLATDDENLCVRFYRREDGTILTRDCPKGLQRLATGRRKFGDTVAAFFGIGITSAVLLPLQVARPRPAAHRMRLFTSAQTGDATGVRGSLDAGSSPDTRFGAGRTALMLAAEAGHMPVVRLLLSRGAHPELRDNEGNSALDLAKAAGHTRIAKTLRRVQGSQSGNRSGGMTHGRGFVIP